MIMNFDDWWASLMSAEHKTLGYNNAKFVWNEARQEAASTLYLDDFSLCSSGDKVIIMHSSGEGGSFYKKAFEEVVRKFFNDNF